MMKNRYDISDNIEDRYEPNSNKKVLKNLLGIVDPNEMADVEYEVLSKNTPCTCDTIEEIARAMSEVHGEFEIIHPFREGNGRIGRLIITLMAYQAGFAVESLDAYLKDNWSLYIEGLKEAWDRKYGILTKLFIESLSHEEG